MFITFIPEKNLWYFYSFNLLEYKFEDLLKLITLSTKVKCFFVKHFIFTTISVFYWRRVNVTKVNTAYQAIILVNIVFKKDKI